MAYKQKIGNIFHQIQDSQSSATPNQPGLGGMGEIESQPGSPAPFGGAAVRGLWELGKRIVPKLLRGAKKAPKISNPGNLPAVIPKPSLPKPGGSFGSKVVSFGKEALKYTVGGGVANAITNTIFGSSDSNDDKPTTTTTPPGGKKPGSYVKPGGKATGNMKDYALNSQGRRDEYTARGWKQDNTTSVKGAKPVAVNEVKPSTVTDPVVKNDPIVKPTVNDAPPVDPVKAQNAQNTMDRKSRSIDKKQGKIDQAVADGNTKKATRKQRNLDNKKARMTKKGTLDAKYMSNLGGGDESDKKEKEVEVSATPFKNVPYTSRIQATAQFRKPNNAGQYRK